MKQGKGGFSLLGWLLNLIDNFAFATAANFGFGRFHRIASSDGEKVLIFVILFMGNIIFMSYK